MKGIWNRNLEHEGLQVSFSSKPSQEIISKLKSNGFRWSRRQGIWYAKELSYRVALLNEIAEYGGEVGEKLSFAEKMDQKTQRAEERGARFIERARRTKAQGEALLGQSRSMADIIPMGQPIIIGHHSEKRDRNYRARIQGKYEKGFETLEKAKYYQQRAGAANDFEGRTFNMGTTLRRIKDLEARIRSIDLESDRHIFQWIGDLTRFNSGLDSKRWVQLSRTHLEANERRIAEIMEPLEYWQSIVKQKEAEGQTVWGPDDFKKGYRVKTRFGLATVVKVNKVTVGVIFDQQNLNWDKESRGCKIPYDELPQGCKNVPQEKEKPEAEKGVA